MTKCLVFIPVINEHSNLIILVPQVLRNLPEAHLLIIDDNSIDKTEEFCKKIESDYPGRLTYFRREGRLGVGTAHVDGLMYALENKYDFVISMDGDLTHDPYYLKIFLEKMNLDSKIDLIIGSRFMIQSKIINWSRMRVFITHLGHRLTRLTLGLNEDLSSGYRVYRMSTIPHKVLTLSPSGYSYFPESAYIYSLKGRQIYEFPVVLQARYSGESKLSFSEAIKGLWRLLAISLYLKKKYED